MSSYLSSDDYTDYGLSSSTTDAQVTAASGLLDAYLGRPEGLIWQADAAGRPCCMASQTPSLSLTASDAIAAGDNVSVTLPYAPQISLLGETVILDRDSDTLREACTISAIDGETITLDRVNYDHASGVSVDTGLTITARKRFGYASAAQYLSRTPVVRVLSVSLRSDPHDRNGPRLSDANRHRFGYGDDMGYGCVADILSRSDPNSISFLPQEGYRYSPGTGEIVLYAVSRSLETRISYLAGYASDNLPDIVKIGCAQLVTAMANESVLPSGTTSYAAGDTQITRAVATALSADIAYMLSPFRATNGL